MTIRIIESFPVMLHLRIQKMLARLVVPVIDLVMKLKDDDT